MATTSTSRATNTMDVSLNSSDTQTSNDQEEVNSKQASKTTTSQRSSWFLGRAASHRPNWPVQEWSRAYLLACAAGLIVDPLFFYTLSISSSLMCLFIDGWFAITLTILRCMVDAMHVWNMWLQLKLAYKARRPHEEEEEGSNKIHSNSSYHGKGLGYLKNKKCFFLDLIVILPVMQGRYTKHDITIQNCQDSRAPSLELLMNVVQ